MNNTIAGTVIKGAQRGKSLGFPTANIELTEPVDDGIYISTAEIEGKTYQSVTFVGAPEMFDDNLRRAETYILDFDNDIYGKDISVTLLKKLRESQPFTSVELLIEQMNDDIAQAKAYFSKKDD